MPAFHGTTIGAGTVIRTPAILGAVGQYLANASVGVLGFVDAPPAGVQPGDNVAWTGQQSWTKELQLMPQGGADPEPVEVYAANAGVVTFKETRNPSQFANAQFGTAFAVGVTMYNDKTLTQVTGTFSGFGGTQLKSVAGPYPQYLGLASGNSNSVFIQDNGKNIVRLTKNRLKVDGPTNQAAVDQFARVDIRSDNVNYMPLVLGVESGQLPDRGFIRCIDRAGTIYWQVSATGAIMGRTGTEPGFSGAASGWSFDPRESNFFVVDLSGGSGAFAITWSYPGSSQLTGELIIRQGATARDINWQSFPALAWIGAEPTWTGDANTDRVVRYRYSPQLGRVYLEALPSVSQPT